MFENVLGLIEIAIGGVFICEWVGIALKNRKKKNLNINLINREAINELIKSIEGDEGWEYIPPKTGITSGYSNKNSEICFHTVSSTSGLYGGIMKPVVIPFLPHELSNVKEALSIWELRSIVKARSDGVDKQLEELLEPEKVKPTVAAIPIQKPVVKTLETQRERGIRLRQEKRKAYETKKQTPAKPIMELGKEVEDIINRWKI